MARSAAWPSEICPTVPEIRVQSEAERQERHEQSVGEGLQEIRFIPHEREKPRCGDQRDERRAGQAQRLRRRDEGPGHRFGRQLTTPAEQAVRRRRQDQDHEDEGEQVAVAGAEQGDPIALGKPQDQAAGYGPRHVAEAAEQHRHHAFERCVETHGGVDAVVEHADQQTADGAERGSDGEHRHVHAVGVHPHLARRIRVLSGGAHRPPKLGET